MLEWFGLGPMIPSISKTYILLIPLPQTLASFFSAFRQIACVANSATIVVFDEANVRPCPTGTLLSLTDYYPGVSSLANDFDIVR